MGKQGPCYHCGVTSTPLWRNGPPEKPVLCNACGSRWRTKGTLANYTPLHARAETDDCEDQRVSKVKSIWSNKKKEVAFLKQKRNHDSVVSRAPDYNQGFQNVQDEDTSNRSSSGSAISNSESCAQYGHGGTDASDLTGPVQSVVWDAAVPSKKRTCVGRPKPSSVEKLTKDLCTILHEQQSYLSASSEDDLLFESETPMVSVEIGHGSVLIRHPSYIAREEESEASSLSVDNKQYPMSDAYSYSGAILMHNDSSGMKSSTVEVEKIKNSTLKSDKAQHERLQILVNHASPLCSINLNDLVNYEAFFRIMTYEEQQQLLKLLPMVDTAKLPDSLEVMFNSSEFKENLTYFQQLLAEGVFDISLLGAKLEDCKTLKRLALSNLSKSKWVEHYNFMKECKNKAGKSHSMRSTVTASTNVVSKASTNVANIKRPCDSRNENFPEFKTIMRSPKSVITKVGCEGREVVEDGGCYSPKRLFALPPAASFLLDSLNFVDESTDQDLLLEMPSNTSFPEAEFLHPTLSLVAQASTSSSLVYSHLGHH
ncbi:hypothetical protein Fmac_002205 [Flemingia macrophylla]|uniref:GATA transcription factor 26 n=1 Tax=Flemingia macrophylla TaxID=520843 RepID=A0ABD1NJA1_9FABA